jgi:divalent metal cation (Fe/Co/Zn/Cd) transporter
MLLKKKAWMLTVSAMAISLLICSDLAELVSRAADAVMDRIQETEMSVPRRQQMIASRL